MKFIRRHWKGVVLSTIFVIVAALLSVGYVLYVEADKVISSVTSSGSVADLLKPEPLNGESTGSVNILIAGNSVDDPNHGGAALTDSIILANYTIASNRLTLISIPRDLYVKINGTYRKINEAYVDGGMDELQKVVEQVTGVTINQRVLIDYSAVRDMIDAVGGIDVTINSSDPRGIYDPMIGFSITNGPHHLTGEQALLLARCRNDPTYDGRVPYGLPNGDFDRQANQRMIMEALLKKIESSSTLTNVSELQKLINSLEGNVTTNFSAGQLRRLYDLSREVSTVNSVTLRGTDSAILLTDYKTPQGEDALIPTNGVGDYTSIQAYVTKLLAPASTTSTQ